MNIRKIQIEDFQSISKLVQQVHELHCKNRPDIYNDINPFEKSYFDFLMNSENTISIVCEIDNEIVGFCITTIRKPSNNPLLKPRIVAYIENMCVDINYRRNGIGKKLFDEILYLSKNQGATNVELMAWNFNSKAIAFYEKLGFSYRSHIMEYKE